MTITFGDVRGWRAAPLGHAGDGLKKDASALEKSRDKLETQGIPDSWSGLASFVAAARRNAHVAQMTTHIEGKRTLQRALYDAETQVTEIERLVTDVEGTARDQEFTIGADGSVTDAATPPEFNSRWEAEEYGRSRSSQAQALADDITTILSKAAAADAMIANGIPSGHVNDVDERGTASPEVAERWAELSDAQRRAIIEELIEELAEEHGVEVDDIAWDETDGNGAWSDGDKTVHLNPDRLDDPDLLHTVAHELRHAQQHEAVRDHHDSFHWPWDDPFDEHEDNGITEDQAEEWDDNFDKYQSPSAPGVSFEDYYDQPVEEDARDAGREYVDGLTADELDRLLEESQ